MSVGQESRYNYAAIIRVIDAAGFLAEPEHLDIRPQLQNIVHADNQEYVPSPNDNWSRIAWKKLGHGKYWWIIADYSQIVDPFTELLPVKKAKYLSQLTVNVPALSLINEIAVKDVRKFNKGDVIRVEDLNPAHAVSFETGVLSTNATLKTVQLSPIMTPSGGVPFALSRVSKVYKEDVRLIVPSPNRAFFEALNFGNPLNVMTE